MTAKLFVGGLPWAMDNTRLREVFSEYGAVADAKIILDAATGKSRGFGFVTFVEQASAEKALVLDGQEIDGRRVRIDRAQERPRGPGGFSGPRSPSGPAPSGERSSSPPTRSGYSERPRDPGPSGPRDLGPVVGQPAPGYGPPAGDRGPGPGDCSAGPDRGPSRGQARGGERGGRGGPGGGGGERERGGRSGRDRKHEDDAAGVKQAGRGGRRRIDDYDFE